MPGAHRGGIGIGGADAPVARALVAPTAGRCGSSRRSSSSRQGGSIHCDAARLAVARIGSRAMPVGQIVSGAVGISRRLVCWSIVGKELGHVSCGVVIEARHEGIEVGVGGDLRRIEVELPAPDRAPPPDTDRRPARRSAGRCRSRAAAGCGSGWSGPAAPRPGRSPGTSDGPGSGRRSR